MEPVIQCAWHHWPMSDWSHVLCLSPQHRYLAVHPLYADIGNFSVRRIDAATGLRSIALLSQLNCILRLLCLASSLSVHKALQVWSQTTYSDKERLKAADYGHATIILFTHTHNLASVPAVNEQWESMSQ